MSIIYRCHLSMKTSIFGLKIAKLLSIVVKSEDKLQRSYGSRNHAQICLRDITQQKWRRMGLEHTNAENTVLNCLTNSVISRIVENTTIQWTRGEFFVSLHSKSQRQLFCWSNSTTDDLFSLLPCWLHG